MKKKISLRVITRISFYYEALLKLDIPNDSYISSKKLEEITGVSCNQIRQDFFYLGISIGRQKKGYQVKKLFKELKRILSIDNGADVIVIGAGRLGRALSEYELFKVRNINVKALFDVKPELMDPEGTIVEGGIPIYHMNSLQAYLDKNPQITIAMLTVPETSAQDILNMLVEMGIKGIVNFAPKILRLPPKAKNIHLVNDCIGASLYKIVYQINRRK